MPSPSARLAPVILAAAAVLAGAFAAGTAQDADAAKRTCSPKGSRTVESNSVARLYVRPGSEGGISAPRVFGCALATKRPILLTIYGGYDSGGYRADLRGRIVAVSSRSEGPDDVDYGDLKVFDLKNKKPFIRLSDVDVRDVALGPKLSFAWIGNNIDQNNDDQPVNVRIHDSRGARTLTTGGVVPGSLAVAGTTVYWTQDGTPRSAKLVP